MLRLLNNHINTSKINKVNLTWYFSHQKTIHSTRANHILHKTPHAYIKQDIADNETTELLSKERSKTNISVTLFD